MRMQTSPLGLLGAFGLKVQGKAPDQFGESIAPSVEVIDFYALASQSIKRTAQITAAGAVTDTITHVVPNDTIWRVFAVASGVNLNAADLAKSVNFAQFWEQPDGTAMPFFMGPGGGLATVADRWAPFVPGPIVTLGPGWKLRSVMTITAALIANASFEFSVLRQELDA